MQSGKWTYFEAHLVELAQPHHGMNPSMVLAASITSWWTYPDAFLPESFKPICAEYHLPMSVNAPRASIICHHQKQIFLDNYYVNIIYWNNFWYRCTLTYGCGPLARGYLRVHIWLLERWWPWLMHRSLVSRLVCICTHLPTGNAPCLPPSHIHPAVLARL